MNTEQVIADLYVIARMVGMQFHHTITILHRAWRTAIWHWPKTDLAASCLPASGG
jgi:hypothetical protein